jgi:hypothetical protein
VRDVRPVSGQDDRLSLVLEEDTYCDTAGDVVRAIFKDETTMDADVISWTAATRTLVVEFAVDVTHAVSSCATVTNDANKLDLTLATDPPCDDNGDIILVAFDDDSFIEATVESYDSGTNVMQVSFKREVDCSTPGVALSVSCVPESVKCLEVPPPEGIAQAVSYGLARLKEKGIRRQNTFIALQQPGFLYQNDYDLGDLVTFQFTSSGGSEDFQIRQVEIVYSNSSGESVVLEFGGLDGTYFKGNDAYDQIVSLLKSVQAQATAAAATN